MHGEIAGDVAALLASLFHVPALESNFGKLGDVKKFRTA